MYRNALLTIAVALGALALAGCSNGAPTPEADGKIPVTTSSEEAREEFLKGRDLAERLLAHDSIQHFDRAITLDPDFALAHLGRANASPTPKEFFDHLNKAVSLSDRVSEGERLLILGAEAGANGDPMKQREYFEQLVAAYPDDERARLSMGNNHFGQQEHAKAVEHYRAATELAPDYAPAYNILGYAYRQMANYADAEQAFRKYTELIPDDPNPYDSYAELLLKMGRYEDSIEQYRKALSLDPNFVASHVGIAANLMYQEKPDEARAELRKIIDTARNDGERRTALLGMAVLAIDGGEMTDGLQILEERYTLAERSDDAAAMAGDLQLRGTVLFETGNYDEAKEAYDRALEIIESSSLSDEIKDNARLTHHRDLATVALGKKDYLTAKAEAEAFREGAGRTGNAAFVRQAHALAGRIAMAEEDYDAAIEHLGQASRQNSYNLYRLSLAHQAKGDAERAAEYCERAAQFNPLPSMTHAFIRKKAEDMLEDIRS